MVWSAILNGKIDIAVDGNIAKEWWWSSKKHLGRMKYRKYKKFLVLSKKSRNTPCKFWGKFESFMLVVGWTTPFSCLRSSHLLRFIASLSDLPMWIYSLTLAAFINHMKEKPNNVGPFGYQLTDNWWKSEPRGFWRETFSSASPLSCDQMWCM